MYINTSNELSFTKNKPELVKKDPEENETFLESSGIIYENENSISYWATKILKTADPKQKANLTEEIAKKWLNNEINQLGNISPPNQPERLETLSIVDPGKIRRGKGGTLVKKIA